MLAAVIGTGAYAFTASNEVPAKRAGAGNGTVSGYKVTSQLSYTFSEDGTKMTAVSFNLNHAASDVQVALSAAAPKTADWVDCGASGASAPYAVSCTFPAPVPDGEGLKLSVAAVSSGKVTIE